MLHKKRCVINIKLNFHFVPCFVYAHFHFSANLLLLNWDKVGEVKLIQNWNVCFGFDCYRDNLAKNVQVSPPEPGWERQQAATPKCHWIISFIGLIVRIPIVDLRADTGQIYRNWNVSPRAFLHYFNENFNYFTQFPLKMNKNVCKQ